MKGMKEGHALTPPVSAADGENGAAQPPPSRRLSPAAQRALAEAEARRAAMSAAQTERAREINGRGGLDPVRYGDWEIKGLTSDF